VLVMNGRIDHVALPELSDHEKVEEEQSLIAAVRSGDGRAYATLVRPHLSMLHRLAARVSNDSALAEDIVQDALLLAYERIDRYRPGTSLRAYLAAITVKKAQTAVRSEVRRRHRQEKSYSPRPSETGEELLNVAEQRHLVREALNQMPDKRRMAALLRLEVGLSYREIAEALDSTEGSTRVLVHQALKELRSNLGRFLS
jgi:RNA polymerase sigma-70 factor, ECF subfamily